MGAHTAHCAVHLFCVIFDFGKNSIENMKNDHLNSQQMHAVKTQPRTHFYELKLSGQIQVKLIGMACHNKFPCIMIFHRFPCINIYYSVFDLSYQISTAHCLNVIMHKTSNRNNIVGNCGYKMSTNYKT